MFKIAIFDLKLRYARLLYRSKKRRKKEKEIKNSDRVQLCKSAIHCVLPSRLKYNAAV